MVHATNTHRLSYYCCLLADFVDALSDPMAFMSQAEKRAKQMQDMGIEEGDISDVPVTTGKKKEDNKKKAEADTPNSKAPAGEKNQTKTNATTQGTPQATKDEKKGVGKLVNIPMTYYYMVVPGVCYIRIWRNVLGIYS